MAGTQMFKILVVDDEVTVCDSVMRCFTRIGYDCHAVYSALDALQYLEMEQVHLAFLDFKLPEMDGIELFRRIREMDQDIAVVMMTGYGTIENAVEALKLGASDFLTKPVELDRLVLAARSALDKRRLSMENRKFRENFEQIVKERTNRLVRTNRQLESGFLDTIRTFSSLLEKRDQSMGSHSKRVAVTCLGICNKLDLRENIRQDIETGALLHDIGKIGIPDAILRRSANFFEISKLTDEERRIVRLHPITGQEAVEMIEMLNPVSLIIRHHHEQFNGTGYPDQLSGYNIPLGSRIITVADAFDKVVYGVEKGKRAVARKVIMEHLKRNAGILYDPDVVNAFLEYAAEQEDVDNKLKERVIPISEMQSGMTLSRDLFTTGGILLVSQNTTVSDADYIRITRFRQRKAVMDTVHIYVPDAEAVPAVDVAPPVEQKIPAIKVEVFPQEVNRENILNFKRVKDVIDKTTDLGTLSSVYHTAISLLNDPSSTRRDIAAVLKQDPAIVAKMLRVVNSPLFAFSRRITAIEDAIPLLGFNEIRNIVTSVSVITQFAGKGSDVFDRPAFWKHSAACAIVCKILAHKLKVASEEEYFTAALLHDLGKLVFDQLFEEEFHRVITLVEVESLSMRDAERMVFGRSHQAVGEYLLRKWKIPDILVDSVLYHHNPKDSKVDPFLVSSVHAADIVVHILGIGQSGERHVPELDDFAHQQLGLGKEDIEILIPEIEEQIRQSNDLLNLGESGNSSAEVA